MDKEQLIKEILAEALVELDPALHLNTAIQLAKPSQVDFGDLSTNLAMTVYQQVKERFSSPRDFALALVKKIKEKPASSFFQTVSIAGPGFINFKLTDQYFLTKLAKISQHKSLELINLGQAKSAIVEYSSPNIAKPFTIGHLRSTIIGDSIANLLEASGYRVFRDNHLGDWGTQFGKQIVAIKRFGDEAKIAQSPKPVAELVALYVKFHEEAEKDPSLDDEAREWFRKLEEGDQEARRIWQKCIDWSFKEFASIYAYLGVTFTENNGRGYGESYFEGMLQALIQELKEKGLAKEGKEGAILIFYPNDELPPLMIAKKDGSTLYATRDLATDRWRRENPRYRNSDGSAPLVINEVGSEQAFYFQQLYRAEEILGWYKKKERVHVKHGLYRFKEGKMSTRKGNVIFLEEVLTKAKEKALAFTKDDDVAQAVSVAALKWNDLKRKSEININFDWKELLNLQGNSGPYMLYTYARAKSIMRKAAENAPWQNHLQNTHLQDVYLQDAREGGEKQTLVLNSLERELLNQLDDFSQVVAKTASEFAPHYLCNYLFDLAQLFNSFYNKYSVLNDPDKGSFRLQLVEATAIILNAGLGFLGIKTLEKM